MATEPCPTCGERITSYIQMQCLHCDPEGEGMPLLDCSCEDCRAEKPDYLNEVQDRDE